MGRSLAEVQQLGHDEYVRWRAFMTWRKAMRDHAAAVAAARRR